MELNEDLRRVVAELVELACVAGGGQPTEEAVAVLVAAGISVPPRAECEDCTGLGKILEETRDCYMSEWECSKCSGTGHVRLPERMLTDYQRHSVGWIKRANRPEGEEE